MAGDSAPGAAAPARRKSMRAKAIVTLVILVLAVAALVFYGLVKNGFFKAKEKKIVAEVIREVTIRKAKKQDTELTLSGSAEARPCEEALISSKASGVIEKLLFEEGDSVKEGDILVEIERAELQFQVDKAKALLTIAQANLAKAKTPYRPEEIRSLEANLERAKAALENTKLDLNRARDLWRSRTISQGDWDNAESQFRIKTAECTDAQEKLNLAKSGGREEDIRIAEGDLLERQAELGLANQALADARIVCELSGMVVERYVSRGERVAVGSRIASVADISKVKMDMFVPEVDFARIARGNRARLALLAFPGETFQGQVSLKGVSADTRTRTFKVEILVDNPDGRIRPGMTADVVLLWGKRASAIVIPERAILTENGGAYVYLANTDVCARQTVKPGLNQGGEVIIEDGLKEGDSVVVSGQDLLNEGARIKVVGEE